MCQMCRLIFFLVFVVLSNSFSRAQEVVSSDGNFIAGSGGSLSWTLGEMITETFENQPFYLTQGFQQSNFGDAGSSSVILQENISIGPNPFTSFLRVSGKDLNSTFTLNIHDSQSRLVLETEVSFHVVNETIILPLPNLSDGLYILSMKKVNCNELFHKRIIKI